MTSGPGFDPAPEDGVIALRRWRAADADQITTACGDPEIVRWTTVPAGYDDAEARAFLARTAAQWESGEQFNVAVVPAEEPARVLGSIALIARGQPREREIGYWVAPDARRRGVATRAVRLLSAWGFERLALERIELLALVGNDASAAVAARAGYRREGVVPARAPSAEGIDRCLLFSLSAP